MKYQNINKGKRKRTELITQNSPTLKIHHFVKFIPKYCIDEQNIDEEKFLKYTYEENYKIH